jgi:hypothetical protein
MRYLLPALFSLACLPAQAQQAPTVTFGLKAGASLASLTNRDLQSTSNRRYLWGFHAGLTGNYVLGRGFSLQAEALYSQKGVRDALSAGLAGYEDHLRLHYLDLLALARFRSQGFYFEVGPQLGVLLTARDQVTVPTVTTHEQTVTDSFHRLELGVGSGVGYQLASGPGIGLRTNVGLLNVPNINPSGMAVRNNTFQLYLTYQFSHKP